jgi:hypothetical protein
MNGGPQFSIANAQQVFLLAKLALESHALGDSKRRDEAALDLLASPLAHEPVFPAGLVKVCRKSVSVTGLKQRQQLLERLLRLLELLDNCRAVHYHVISRYDLAAQSKTWRKIRWLFCMPPIQISAQDLTIFSVIIIPMMLKLALIAVLLISWQACSAETPPEGQFSVSVVSSSGKSVDAPQVYVVTKGRPGNPSMGLSLCAVSQMFVW